ncbi:hypothetical protein ACTFIR_007483 [Dictyostelium discoideum]
MSNQLHCNVKARRKHFALFNNDIRLRLIMYRLNSKLCQLSEVFVKSKVYYNNSMISVI